MRLFFAFISLIVATIAFPGCYSTGAHGKLPFATVTIMPVKSEIDFASTQVLLAKNVAEAINAEPGLTTKVEGGAAELFITLSNLTYSSSVASNYDSRVNAVENITITAKISLRNARKGDWYFQNRNVSASIQVYLSDLNATQAYPAISRELARRIKDQIVSVW